MRISLRKRRIMVNTIVLSTIIAIIILIIALNATGKKASPSLSDIEAVSKEGYYTSYLASYSDSSSEEEHDIPLVNTSIPDDEIVDGHYHWETESSISFEVEVQNPGFYNIYLDYQTSSDSYISIGLSVKVNGSIPYYEASQITLDTLWSDANSSIGVDRYGNDVSALQEVYSKWQKQVLQDASRLYPRGLKFYLEDGINQIEIEKISGTLELRGISICSPKKLPSYSEYLNNNLETENPYLKRIEAEDMEYKNSSTIIRGTNRDVNVLPFSKTKLKLNVVGIDSYQKPGESGTWKVDINKPGYYHLTFKVSQLRQNSTSYRTLYINGKIPFQEAEHLAFPYLSKWQNITLQSLNGEKFLFYLEPGDEISLVVNGSPFVNVTDKIIEISTAMTNLGLDVTKITRNNIDKNIDWDMLEYFPNLPETLDMWQKEMSDIIDVLRKLYGFSSDSQIIQDIKSARDKINTIAEDINELPRRLNLLSRGSFSAVQMLSTQVDNILTQPLIIDALYIHTPDQKLPSANASFFQKTWISIARFFLSFVDQSYSEKSDPDEIEVWVNRSRQYVDLIQKIADDYFTKDTGLKVKVSIMSDDGKLILANSANQQPDIALGVSSWIPGEYGMRGMLYDLTETEDFRETIKVYNPEQLVPMIYDDKLYGLPETGNFYVLLYRTDIIDKLDLQIPNTWDDVLDMIPILERYGMSFYIPFSNVSSLKSYDTTSPFIHQFEGKLFTDDGLKAAVDDENTIKALTFISDLYREYSLPYQVTSFFNSFRYGTMPIGICDYGTYLQLINAASEIKGLWDIALVPGVEQKRINSETNEEETYINRSMPGSQQSGIIFNDSKKKAEAWQFLKWWMSTDTQVLFADTLVNTLGSRYLWNSANIEAFSQSTWQKDHKEVILEQWQHLKEVPKIPGSYIVEREISNSLNNVIFYDANIRSTLSDSLLKMNKEISRKMKEFGYLNNEGKRIKVFKMPNSDVVKRWLEDE